MRATTPISVTAVRFTDQFDTVPTRIELDGISYELETKYKKVTLRSDDGILSWFEISDGIHRFRLRQDAFRWSLVSMSSVKA